MMEKTPVVTTYHFASLESQLVLLHQVDSHFLRQKRFPAKVLDSRSYVEICFGDDCGLKVTS